MKATIDVILYTLRVLSNGEAPLVIRLTKDKKRKYIRIGISLNPIFWDKLKNKPKSNCPNKEYIENIITEKLSKYQKQILEFQSIGKEYSLTQLKERKQLPCLEFTDSHLNIIAKNYYNDRNKKNVETKQINKLIRSIYY